MRLVDSQAKARELSHCLSAESRELALGRRWAAAQRREKKELVASRKQYYKAQGEPLV